jgi:hypothetical protein
MDKLFPLQNHRLLAVATTLVAAVVLSAAGCIPQNPAAQYRITEVQVAFPTVTERWSFFYGTDQSVTAGLATLALTRPAGITDANMDTALQVNGQPYWTEIAAPERIAVTRRTFPGLKYALNTSLPLEAAWLFEAGSWSRLGQGALSTQVVETQPGSPQFAALSTSETAAVLSAILSRSRGPVVLYQLSTAQPKSRFEPAPSKHTALALAVQYGLEADAMPGDKQDNQGSPSAEPKSLVQGGYGQYGENKPGAYLIASQSQLDSMWGLTSVGVSPSRTPSVDFSKNRVVAFFWGQKSTGGYSIKVVKTQITGTKVRVTLQLRTPDPNSFVTQAITSPFVVLEVSGTPTQVEFVDEANRVLAAAK